MKVARIPLAISMVAGIFCCGNPPSHLPDGGLPPLSLDSASPRVVLPGTRVLLTGSGFVPPEQGTIIVELSGSFGHKLLVPDRIDSEHLEITIDSPTFDLLGGPGNFSGRCEVEVQYSSGHVQRAELDVVWQLVDTLMPRLDRLNPLESGGVIYLGTAVEAAGDGFLLGGRDTDGNPVGEGYTRFQLKGQFQPDGQQAQPWEGTLVLQATEARERTALEGVLPAEALGIVPGTFTGSITVANVLAGGTNVAGNTLVVEDLSLGPPLVASVQPLEASRGQLIEIRGRGFASAPATTVLKIDGTFIDSAGHVTDLSGDNALLLVPDIVSGELARYVLRVQPDGQGGVTGLGAVAGTLTGTLRPVIFWQSQQYEGVELSGGFSFRVLPQKQVVYLKYLPGFSDALRRFGLRNVEYEIRQRILEVLRRDYWDQGINVVFQETRPVDFVEYGVVEIGGDDPNGRDLLGLDATMTEMGAKDMGNVYFDDVVGGWNAESAESGHLAYGGVFLSSFLLFSPKSENSMPIADPLFDEVFEQFMPERGGRPVEAGELPGGPRADAIRRAIHALGSMVGNTISHEWGHTLGLAYGWGPADVFHNLEPGPNQIMDAGVYRPFAERAELNGQGPATWTRENLEYLRAILPRP